MIFPEKWWMFFVVLVASVVFVHSDVGVSAASERQGPTVLAALLASDSRAPDFQLADLDGAAVTLSKFKGDRPVLLYFWATWCPYCLQVKPTVFNLRSEVARKDLEIIGIDVGGGDTLERLKRYQEAHPAPYPVVFDADGKVARSYQVQGIPLFVVVDKEGTILYKGNEFPKNIKQILNLH